MRRRTIYSDSIFDGMICDGKPRIYIANHIHSRDIAAVLAALNKSKTCLLISEKRCAENSRLRYINKKRVITVTGGINTKWLHDALKRLKGGESLLIFPDDENRADALNDGFNPAFVLLSLLSGAEIIPLYSRPRRTVFHCLNIKAGEPILPDNTAALTAEVLKKEGERARIALSALAET